MLLFNSCFRNVSVISLLDRKAFFFLLEMGFYMLRGGSGSRHSLGVGVGGGGGLCAKLKLHKIAPKCSGHQTL